MALLKLGISWGELLAMPEAEGTSLLLAHDDLVNPKPKKMKVKRP